MNEAQLLKSLEPSLAQAARELAEKLLTPSGARDYAVSDKEMQAQVRACESLVDAVLQMLLSTARLPYVDPLELSKLLDSHRGVPGVKQYEDGLRAATDAVLVQVEDAKKGAMLAMLTSVGISPSVAKKIVEQILDAYKK